MTAKFNIFEDKTPMPPKGKSEDVCRAAMTPPEVHYNMLPASLLHDYASVRNLDRPRKGHGY
jgi:hypothetical protein